MTLISYHVELILNIDDGKAVSKVFSEGYETFEEAAKAATEFEEKLKKLPGRNPAEVCHVCKRTEETLHKQTGEPI